MFEYIYFCVKMGIIYKIFIRIKINMTIIECVPMYKIILNTDGEKTMILRRQ